VAAIKAANRISVRCCYDLSRYLTDMPAFSPMWRLERIRTGQLLE